jgi:hypothetical protein
MAAHFCVLAFYAIPGIAQHIARKCRDVKNACVYGLFSDSLSAAPRTWTKQNETSTATRTATEAPVVASSNVQVLSGSVRPSIFEWRGRNLTRGSSRS